MTKTIEISVSPEAGYNDTLLRQEVLSYLKLPSHSSDIYIKKIKRSIDARSRNVKIIFLLEVSEGVPVENGLKFQKDYQNVSSKKQAVIIGAGPAGMFAALRLIELGIKPILLERGKDVQARRRDLAAINKEHIVNPDSNYCFGEGGAGTYSDGKLYTRSKKRGDVRRILEILVAHGATDEILIDSHPHIGTNKLPKVVTDLRESILNAGGEIHFDTRVTDLILEKGEVRGAISEGKSWSGLGVILATGHSARDIYHLLHTKKIIIQSKPFALGVRVEHQQSLIDRIQYHCEDRGDILPASSYALVHQAKYNGVERGVFSFCMCPGGFIVPAATDQEEVVVNGMSPSRRDSEFANSGIVVAVNPEDLKGYAHYGPFQGLEFQKEIEKRAWEKAGKTQRAPAQLLHDFVNRKRSATLLKTSYQPGLTSVTMDEILPPMISERLREGFRAFGQKMNGYLSNDAQIVGVESRTSSPIFIPRNKETFEHIETKRLYPCGEGAGYAGGIVSAAMDGERCAEHLAHKYGTH